MKTHVGEYQWKVINSFAFEKTPRISLSSMLDPVQYEEYEQVRSSLWKGWRIPT